MGYLVYIVIVNYNGWNDTIECIESLLRSSYNNFKIFVIDNKSPNDSLAKIKQWAGGDLPYYYQKHNALHHVFNKQRSHTLSYKSYKETEFLATDLQDVAEKLTIIEAEENNGFAAGNNIVLRKLLHQDACVWLLNPDMVAENDTLEKLLNCHAQNPKAIHGTPVKSYYNPEEFLNFGCGRVNSLTGTISFISQENQIPELEYISGGSLFTHASSFRDIGLLEEGYFLYWEETDWCFKARNAGYSLLLCKDVFVYDKISTSIGKGYLAEYYYTLNSLKFFKKYKGAYIPLVLSSNLLRLAKRVFSKEMTRAKAIVVATKDYLLHTN